jgi:hypothetical protein
MKVEMTTRFTSALALVLAMSMPLAGGVAVAQTKAVLDKPDTTAEQNAVLFEKAGAVGTQHQRLAEIAGNWAVTQYMWTAPNSAPKVDNGSATYAMVLGGRHLRQILRINSMDKAFEALGYIGYDNVAGDYYSSWMDINFTGMILAHGEYDAASKAYTFNGSMADPANGGAALPLRAVLRTADRNHLTYDFYETRNGTEALAVRLEYTRVH